MNLKYQCGVCSFFFLGISCDILETTYFKFQIYRSRKVKQLEKNYGFVVYL